MIRVLQSDETAERLAAIYYGDWSLYRLIVDANLHVDWDAPTAGLQIQIPEPLSRDVEHMIQDSDSYQSLSLRYYGTESFAWKIEKLNQLILHENIGRAITIPQLVAAEALQRHNEVRPR